MRGYSTIKMEMLLSKV